jgi:tRNA-specific 2-thiouridylase
LKKRIQAKKWPIIDTTGKVLGEHDGAFQYTIWQRKGICVGGGPALYVVEKNVETNTIIVWQEDDPRLQSTVCIVWELNWLEDVSLPLVCEVQIRYRQMPQKCTLMERQSTHRVWAWGLQTSESKTKDKVQNEGLIGSDNSVNLSTYTPTHLRTCIKVSFETPQRAITPGQVCVFYNGDVVLGSGIIVS